MTMTRPAESVARQRAEPRPPRGDPGPGRASPARPAGRAGLVAGRAGDQRLDRRRGPAAARVPRHPHRRADRRHRPLDPVQAARRRHLVQLLRRQARPVHHGRGLRRAAAGRRPARRLPHGPGRGLDPRRGGIPATRVFTRIWLALFGEWSWDDLPVMPPELIYLPSWFPLNVYDWACWARQTIVPLTIVGSLRPVRSLPFGLGELHGPAGRRDTGRLTRPRRPSRIAGRRRLGAGLRRARPGPARLRPARAAGPAAARRPVGRDPPLRRLDPGPAGEGRLLGRHPAALGVLADRPAPARLRAEPPGHRARPGRAGLASPSGRTDPDGPVRRLEACQSPVWDTVLAMIGAGRRRACPPTTRRWSGPRAGCSTRRSAAPVTGRYAARAWSRAAGRSSSTTTSTPTSTTPPRSCWPWTGPRCPPAPALREAIDRGTRWLTGMQSKDGGWGAFDADNTRRLVTEAAVLRLRRGHRPAVGRRDRARGRGPGQAGPGAAPGPSAGAWPGCCGPRRATGPGSAAGAPTTSTGPARSCPR